MKISNYDQFQYDYSTYWKNRNYEHFSEVIALHSLLKNGNFDWFLDLGGSYGRHIPTYINNVKHPVIVDYSLNTLLNNKFRILEKYPQTTLIAANAYYLPFRDNTFDAGTMIRVLHHINDTNSFFKELERVMQNSSTFFLEYANKMHIKARVKHFIKRDMKFFNMEPYQQPTKNQFEGSDGVETIFLNYHPKYMSELLDKYKFTIEKSIGVSFFRHEIFKKLIPFKILILLESLNQKLMSFLDLTPSIFVKLKSKKESENPKYSRIEEMLVCPKCKSELQFKKEVCTCTKCKNVYEKVTDIWDFRVQ